MKQERIHKQRKRRDVEEPDETEAAEWWETARALDRLLAAATTVVADIEREAS